MDSSKPSDLSPNSRPTSTTPTRKPKHVSIPLPLSPHINLHIQITHDGSSILAFITTTESSNAATLSCLGSFVYAMPNRPQPNETLSTPLYAVPTSIDFATRAAKIVARRTGKPTYIGCSVALGSTTVEEELAAVKAAIDGILSMVGNNPAEGSF